MTTDAIAIEDLPAARGRELGPSSWYPITQDDIDVYADLTGDDNPLHVDEAAAAASPFGGRIAHGMLTLSMVVLPLREIYRVSGASAGIVYGFDRIRFPAPTPSGGRIRLAGRIAEVEDRGDALQVTLALTFEVEGSTKPGVVAELILRHFR
ncbi:MaoC family dehydratase [Microbacterium sp. SORGH_AS_0862]|uniref:MaoC family dehydratase n=1 Tax=Microbacterium sp. SORGH_AS_0862 TaxID=3041789 RepID=UPI0027911EB9|nr:MaoC family dehydratase [Microbacterium sp. SORGH_AS_0862]MDQ1204702.1 acyl dehydratase [Microbacterium sp. SORGH_AS_0862]